MRPRYWSALFTITCSFIAGSVLADAPICAAKLRPGRVVSAESADCDFSYRVSGTHCSARGKCPDLNEQQQDCIAKDVLVYSWTVTKTGGTGSVTPGAYTGAVLTVSVVPPVDYRVECIVSGCSACCAIDPPLCSAPEAPAPPAPAAPEMESKKSCGGR
jgi:hypothetical protein